MIPTVLKKNKKLRLYINYKKLNRITVKNCYIFLFILKFFNKITEVKYFLKIDLKNAYYYIYI